MKLLLYCVNTDICENQKPSFLSSSSVSAVTNTLFVNMCCDFFK